MQPGRRLIKGAPTFPGRSRTGGGADEGEARVCFPWATECSHTQPKPWSAAHKTKPVHSGFPAPHIPWWLQRPPLGVINSLLGRWGDPEDGDSRGLEARQSWCSPVKLEEAGPWPHHLQKERWLGEHQDTPGVQLGEAPAPFLARLF